MSMVRKFAPVMRKACMSLQTLMVAVDTFAWDRSLSEGRHAMVEAVDCDEEVRKYLQ